MQPLPRWPRCLAVGAALLLIGLAGCAGGGKELSMSQGFNRWLKDRGLSASGDATQGPDAIFIPDVPASQTEGGWPRPTAWPRAATLSFVFLDGSGDTPQAPTKMRLLTGGGVLFARFDCRDDDAERLVCTSLGRDAPHLWRDDCVELIFRPKADAGVGTAHIIVNPMGAMSDSADGASGAAGASWDPPFRRRCRITKAGWAAELAMPLRAFVPTGPVPAVWRANFSRSRPGREGVFAEDTGWRATGSLRINVPDSFGWLYFQAVERKRVIPPLASFRPGGRDLLAELRDTGRLQRILRARYGRPAAIAARGEAGQLAPEARIELSALAEGTEIGLEPTAATLHQDRDAIILRVRCQESDLKSPAAAAPAAALSADDVSIYLAPWRKE
ncbi:MAG: hypothetical protein AMJ81_06010, partial [Phycisphaerae bacterium SM23_33]